MENIKAVVTFILPGRVMYSEKECEQNPQLTESLVAGKHSARIRKCKPACQKMNITETQYKNMISSPVGLVSAQERIEFMMLTPHQRVINNLIGIKNDLRAISFHVEYID